MRQVTIWGGPYDGLIVPYCGLLMERVEPPSEDGFMIREYREYGYHIPPPEIISIKTRFYDLQIDMDGHYFYVARKRV